MLENDRDAQVALRRILAANIDEVWSQTTDIERVYSNRVSLKSVQNTFKNSSAGKTKST